MVANQILASAGDGVYVETMEQIYTLGSPEAPSVAHIYYIPSRYTSDRPGGGTAGEPCR